MLTATDLRSLASCSHDEALRLVLEKFPQTGLQATQLGRARGLLKEALLRQNPILCSFTSNLVSCGLRETFAWMARNRLVSLFVSTAGGIEEDVIKCLGETVVGDFSLKGKELREKGLNRIGNLLVPNSNYCSFEDFFMPVLKDLHAKQRASRWERFTSPSEIIEILGEAVSALERREESIVYWCWRNKIPMFCPALTDGSIGDMIFFYNFSQKGLVVDPIPDYLRLRSCAASCTNGPYVALVLGGGLPKHHLLQAIPEQHCGHVVMVSTGNEADGCVSSSCRADDLSHGLVKEGDRIVQVWGDASIVLPLMLI